MSTDRMRRSRSMGQACACLVTLALVACGGGGGADTGGQGSQPPVPPSVPPPAPGNPPLTLTGTAATGQALANATVTARCANGSRYTGVTNGVGQFAIPTGSPAADALPCMLQAVSTTPPATYYSYADSSGPVNINPLTDLTLAKALRGSPADAFERFTTGSSGPSTAAVNDAVQFVLSAMEITSSYKTMPFEDLKTPNPFTQKFELGDDRDRLFDAFAAGLTQTQLSFDEFRSLTIANADLRESFDTTVHRLVIDERITPVVNSVECNEPSVGRGHWKCTVKGRQLSRPATTAGQVYSDLGLVLSLTSTQQPKTDPTRPHQPAWCAIDAMAQGATTFRSTDSADPLGPDPTGAYAEEIEFVCSKDITTADAVTAEVVRDGPEVSSANVAAWPLVGVSAEFRPKLDVGRPVLESLTCTSMVYPGYEFVHSTWVDLRFTGTVTLGANHFFQVFLSSSALTDAQLRDVGSGVYPAPADTRTVPIVASCAGTSPCGVSGGSLVPVAQALFKPDPALFPASEPMPVGGVYGDDLYSPRTVWVYAVVTDVTRTLAIEYSAKSVACPAFGRPR